MSDPTASELIDETLAFLLPQNSDQVTTLSSHVATGTLSFTVSDVRSPALGITPGVVEIGSELIFASDVADDGTVTVPAWGRGYRNTTAVAHNAGVAVTSQPRFPRSTVLAKLNQAIDRVFPKIFAPHVTTLTTRAPFITYDLPENSEWVIDCRWLLPTGLGEWAGCKMWRDSRGGTTVTADPGVAVDVADDMTPGQPIEFTYAARPTSLTDETTLFSTTGLGQSMRDVIVLSAASSLSTGWETSRLVQDSAEQQDRARLVQPGTALATSRYLEQKYQLRLAEEVSALREAYPIRLRRMWV